MNPILKFRRNTNSPRLKFSLTIETLDSKFIFQLQIGTDVKRVVILLANSSNFLSKVIQFLSMTISFQMFYLS